MRYEQVEAKLREIVPHGLVQGLGSAKPGALCIEAAICLALGEPHGDRPSCVAWEDRMYAIRVNDAGWSSKAARAETLLPLGIAQLGTAGTDRSAWTGYVVEQTIRRIVPTALRAAAWRNPSAEWQAQLIAAADRCAAEGTAESAQAAARTALAAYNVAYANAAVCAEAAAYVANVAAHAADDVAVDVAAHAAAEAADAATYDDAAAARDTVLRESVAIALEGYARFPHRSEQREREEREDAER